MRFCVVAVVVEMIVVVVVVVVVVVLVEVVVATVVVFVPPSMVEHSLATLIVLSVVASELIEVDSAVEVTVVVLGAGVEVAVTCSKVVSFVASLVNRLRTHC